MHKRAGLLLAVILSFSLYGQDRRQVSPELRPFVSVNAAVVALSHVRVIDGTGAPPREDQTLLIEAGRIAALGVSGRVEIPDGAQVLDLSGHTVIPGIVGMHDHLFYPSGGRMPLYNDLAFSAPRLYLGGGVTTIRTTGSIEPYTDLNVKQMIDAGKMPGPSMDVTGPYLEGKGAFTPQMHELTGPEDARKLVDYWAGMGVTSFKAYMHITREELSAAVEEAHKRGIKVTGHLCSIGFREAAALGIDDLEHGLVVDSEFVPSKKPDQCPGRRDGVQSLLKLDLNGQAAGDMISDLVSHHVAVTSTLPVFETFVPNRPPLDRRALQAMAPQVRESYLESRILIASRGRTPYTELLKKEMEFERRFAAAGGLLLAGLDPTGYGGVVPGFGDQREIELLVEAGFTPVQAIEIATLNGARYLGRSDRIGSIEVGKEADLVVIRGNPAQKISDIRQVVTVFKKGIGYDSAKLIESARGQVGLN